jgi:xanthine dehydrogenase accessory factor
VRDILPDLGRWHAEGKPIALATVVETWGSAPRPPGGKMAVTADGSIAGSVSGGCVENAVVAAGKKTLSGGKAQLLHYGVSDDTAWSVGLACGGSLDIFLERLDPSFFAAVRDAMAAHKSVAVTTVIAGPEAEVGRKLALIEDGTTVGGIDDAAVAETQAALTARASRRVKAGERELFVDVLLPAPRLVVVGGVHIAVALVTLAKALGFRTILVDPRESFGNPERFPQADEIVSEWPDKALARLSPDASTAVAVLTHDPKLDDPALDRALQSKAFYIGSLGSKKTHAARLQRLSEAGFDQAALARIHGPAGFAIGAKSPAEIAVSVLAQLTAARHGQPTR